MKKQSTIEAQYVGSIVLSCFVLFSCVGRKTETSPQASTNVRKGVWQYSPLRIDGTDGDWTNPLLFADVKSALAYSITNDEKNIYVVIKTSDRTTQAKILYNGIELRMRIDKNSRDPFLLRYPLKADVISNDEENTSRHKKTPLGNADIYEIKGGKERDGLHFRNDSTSGLLTQIGINSNKELVYEVQVPFSLFYKNALTAADKGKTIKCEINIDGFVKNSVSYNSFYRRFNSSKPLLAGYKERYETIRNTFIKKSIPLAVR